MKLYELLQNLLIETQFISITGRTTTKAIEQNIINCRSLINKLNKQQLNNDLKLSNSQVLKIYAYSVNQQTIINIYIDY